MFEKSYEDYIAERKQRDNDFMHAFIAAVLLFMAGMVFDVAYDIGAEDQTHINEQSKLNAWLAR